MCCVRGAAAGDSPPAGQAVQRAGWVAGWQLGGPAGGVRRLALCAICLLWHCKQAAASFNLPANLWAPHFSELFCPLCVADNAYRVMVASDAVGMGLNLNIRRVIFHSVTKHEGRLTGGGAAVPGWSLPSYAVLQRRTGECFPYGKVLISTSTFKQPSGACACRQRADGLLRCIAVPFLWKCRGQ